VRTRRSLACDPASLLAVAHIVKTDWDLDSDESEEEEGLTFEQAFMRMLQRPIAPNLSRDLEQTVLFLCCDEASSHYGKILVHDRSTADDRSTTPQAPGQPRGEPGVVSPFWVDYGLADFVHLMLNVAEDDCSEHPNVPVPPEARRDWDRAWDRKTRLAHIVISILRSHQRE
jgi:hypothetical protein